MPVKRVQRGEKSCYKWGDSGKEYCYTPGDEAARQRAKKKAKEQGRAIRASGYDG